MIMFAIPFGLIGALSGHLLLGMEITIWSLVGMVAVSGVVVNDTLVLVDYINRNRLAGVPLDVAVKEAGAARFRPIMLTSLTTFAGLTPLMLEHSLQAQFMIPMAISLAFGVMFATVVSLILVPSTYFILDDIKSLLGIRSASMSTDKLTAPATPPPVFAEPGSNEDWQSSLDHAYNDGFKAGLADKSIRSCTYQEDSLQASWEAGWQDGINKNKQE